MPVRLRNILISIFVILWTIIFHYESTRAFYLQPFFEKELPKLKFLFPPAGWIMFFNVDDSYGYAQVYGISEGVAKTIDAHKILRIRAVGYDNIQRNVLSTVLSRSQKEPFCKYLFRRFPEFENFAITAVTYSSLTKDPWEYSQAVIYACR